MFAETEAHFQNNGSNHLTAELDLTQEPKYGLGEKKAIVPSSQIEHHTNQEIQQIPHNGDRLVMMINFMLREVLTIQSREARLKLLDYYLGAILSESLLSPFTSLAYSIGKNKEGKLTLYDDIYQTRPDLLAVVEVAAASVIDAAEQRRYNLEKDQVARIVMQIKSLISDGTSPQVILQVVESAISDEKYECGNELAQAGWLPAKGLISQEVAMKMDLPSPDVETYAHKKIIYTMPQSEVHRGNMSVLVVAQPIFIPKLNRVILLHDQCFFSAEWKTHSKIWRKLGVSIPADIADMAQNQNRSAKETQQVEEFFMSQLCVLPNLQLSTARKVFEQLLPEQKLFLAFKEWQKQRIVEGMKKSLHEYSDLILTLMEKEFRAGTLSMHQVNKLSLFLKRIVLAGILTHVRLSSLKASELQALYYEHGHQSEETFARAAVSGLRFAAAGKAIDLSLLECVSVGTINGFGMRESILKIQLNPSAINRTDIAKVIGMERAKKWKNNQICIGCHKIDVWVGECGLCLPCELHEKSSAEIPKTLTEISSTPLVKKQSEATVVSNQTIAVGNLIASLI